MACGGLAGWLGLSLVVGAKVVFRVFVVDRKDIFTQSRTILWYNGGVGLGILEYRLGRGGVEVAAEGRSEMEEAFAAWFVSWHSKPVVFRSQRPGLWLLDAVRAIFGPQVSLEELVNLPDIAADVAVAIGEEEARRSGHFDDTNVVDVFVPPASLNRFVHFEPKRREDGLIDWVFFFDEAAVLAAWAAAGYPLEWDAE